jgi:hypothetical protein
MFRTIDLFAPRELAVAHGAPHGQNGARVKQQRPRPGPDGALLHSLAASGLSLRKIASEAGLSQGTVRRRLREAGMTAGPQAGDS